MLGVLFIHYVGAGYFVVPRVVESHLVRIVEEQTGGRPELEDVAFDPFRVLELLKLNLSLDEVPLVAPRFCVPIVS